MEEANKNGIFKWFTKNKSTFIFTISVIVVTVLFLITGYSTYIKEHFSLNSNNFGQLGDFFNGIAAPVLSLITIILLYNSFLVQKEELTATRQALEQSTKEMQNSVASMERAEQNAKLERLESICFKLLDKYEDSRNSVWSDRSSKYNIGDYLPRMNTKYHIIKLKLKIVNNNNQVDKRMIDQFLNSFIEKLKEENHYNEIKSLVYKFIAIYNCILSSKILPEELKYLRFAINNYLTNEEMFFVKLFINQLDDLKNLRTELSPFGIESTSESIYELHIKEEINKQRHNN